MARIRMVTIILLLILIRCVVIASIMFLQIITIIGFVQVLCKFIIALSNYQLKLDVNYLNIYKIYPLFKFQIETKSFSIQFCSHFQHSSTVFKQWVLESNLGYFN